MRVYVNLARQTVYYKHFMCLWHCSVLSVKCGCGMLGVNRESLTTLKTFVNEENINLIMISCIYLHFQTCMRGNKFRYPSFHFGIRIHPPVLAWCIRGRSTAECFRTTYPRNLVSIVSGWSKFQKHVRWNHVENRWTISDLPFLLLLELHPACGYTEILMRVPIFSGKGVFFSLFLGKMFPRKSEEGVLWT